MATVITGLIVIVVSILFGVGILKACMWILLSLDRQREALDRKEIDGDGAE